MLFLRDTRNWRGGRVRVPLSAEGNAADLGMLPAPNANAPVGASATTAKTTSSTNAAEGISSRMWERADSGRAEFPEIPVGALRSPALLEEPVARSDS